jgi:serine-threonine kinase receptor-associated protein
MQIYKGHHGPIWCLQFAHHGNTFATASEDGTIRIWDSRWDAKDYGL